MFSFGHCQLLSHWALFAGEFSLENLLKSALSIPFLVCKITCVHGEASCTEMGNSLFVKVKTFKYSVNYH